MKSERLRVTADEVFCFSFDLDPNFMKEMFLSFSTSNAQKSIFIPETRNSLEKKAQGQLGRIYWSRCIKILSKHKVFKIWRQVQMFYENVIRFFMQKQTKLFVAHYIQIKEW